MPNKKSPLSEIFKGLKETYSVVIFKKPVKTDFQPKEPHTKSDDDKQKDNTPSSKVKDKNYVIIESEHQQEIMKFISSHSNMDVLEVPCFYNNEPTTAMICAFPRIVENMSKLQVSDVISVTFIGPDGIRARADYGVDGKDAAADFKEDIDRLSPPSRKASYSETVDKLRETFPGIDFDNHTPIFLDDDGPTPNERPEQGELA